MTPRVCLVAAPLSARSGVYRSSRELVRAARAAGLPWSLVLGVSAEAGGARPANDPEWIAETAREPTGLGGVVGLSRVLAASPLVRDAELVVSLVPQSDMALALGSTPWVAYLRGLPWPARGESGLLKRTVWRALERLALVRAAETWATTRVLAEDVRLPGVRLVPPGLDVLPRTWDGSDARRRAVWAARFYTDKNPELFLAILRGLPLTGSMHGSGPQLESIRAAAPPNVAVPGWSDPATLFTDALAYVGTSRREAFGRSAVEAAMAGVPVVLGDRFGAAELLYEDPDLRRRFVLPVGDADRWRAALSELSRDRGLRMAASDHLHDTATRLTVERSAQAAASAVDAVISRRR